MNKIKIFLFLSICFVVARESFSQQYFTKSYTIENGLPTRNVNGACQDDNGTMWFATHEGISSYDGFRFTNYDATNVLPQQHYRKVICDEKGIIWGIPDRLCDTVVYLENKTWKRVLPPSLKQNIDIKDFDLYYKEGKPVICLGTTTGLDIRQNDQWNHLDISQDAERNRILSLTSKGSKFYALTQAGVYVVDCNKNGWGFTEYFKSPDEKIITIKFERPGAPDEKLWLLSSDRLFYLQYGKLTLFADSFILPVPLRIAEGAFLDLDTHGNLFFGNNWAKYFVNKIHGSVSPLMVNNGFSSNGATSVFIDREQNIWFTDTRGIDKIRNLLMTNYFEINGLLDNEVTAIVELADGRMIFGHNNGLTVYDHNKFIRIPFHGPKNNLNRVQDMMQDDRGNVWFASSKMGFGKLMSNGVIKWYPVESSTMATSIHQDANGKIWMGTNRSLFFLQNDQLVSYAHNDKISCPFRKIFTGADGKVIGAGLYGIYIVSGDEVKQVPVDKGVKTQSFYAYYKSRSGVEYVGSLNGLCVIEHGIIRKFNKGGISIDNPIYFILQDHDGNFWFGSNNGVFTWDGKNKLETYNMQNGLSGRETNRSASMIDSHHNIWIGSDMGLTCFSPGFSALKNAPPVVRLLDIEDNKGIIHSFSEECNVGFNDNTLFFHFRGISFVNEDLITYRYKLEGFDRDWQFVNQKNLDKVKYAGLQPGKYRFKVQARNGSGDWSNMVSSGAITIQSPVFHKWWFNVILFLVFTATIFGVIKIFHQRRYNLQLENEITSGSEVNKKR